MATVEIEKARLINEVHRKLNGNLREENKLLGKTLLDMYELFSQIDFGAYDGELKMCFGDSLEYDSVPWEKWEAVLDVVLNQRAVAVFNDEFPTDTLDTAPIQLRLF